MNDKYWTISELNEYIKGVFDETDEFKHILLKGEISNFKAHTRGHLYFSLKDESSKINAVMFEFHAKNLLWTPTDGMNVIVEGRITVYPPNGGYQIYVEKMIEDGIGNLYLKYEALKQKLNEEGLFRPEHKKLIPMFPTRIGVITASTGAAIKDILSTIKRRYPICETILFPTLVQGSEAKDNIVKQIEVANTFELDVIILGRGGGSIEDLWAFNEECVVRAIYNSNIPIISGIGHDVDWTISDFVSDLRAPTPTGAAEMAVPHLLDLNNLIKQYEIRASKAISNQLSFYQNRLESIKSSYILKNPLALYEIKEQKLSNYVEILNKNMQNLLKKYEYDYKLLINKLHLLNPLNILEKGYSVVSKDRKVLKDASDLDLGDEIVIKLFKGKIKASVKEKL